MIANAMIKLLTAKIDLKNYYNNLIFFVNETNKPINKNVM